MSSKLSLLFLILIVLTSTVLGAELNSYSVSESDPLCPGTTGLYVDAIENTGSDSVQVTVSTSGTSSGFATAVPQGFTLNPGQIKFIYTYVTPRSTTPEGTYSLQINANSEKLSHTVQIVDCFRYNLQLLSSEQNICPGGEAEYQFKVENNGEYTDTYNLRLEGPYASQVELSDSQFSLNPGQSKTIDTIVTSLDQDTGKKEFTLVVDPNLGSNIKTEKATVNVDQCYDFSVSSEKNFVSMCESSQETIPLTIKNLGSTDNIYDLSITGPAWINLESNAVTVSSGQEKTVNLVLNPDYGIQGNFQITLISKPRLGNIQAQTTFNVQVNKCHDVSVAIARDSDAICNSLANNYEILIKNNGQFDKEFGLEISGPEWASLDQASLSLDAGEEQALDLTINPSFNTVPGTYPIEIIVTSKDSSRVSDSDKILITTVSREDCYKPKLEATDTNVEVSYDSSATIPIAIENIGASRASYSLSVSGTAANFAYLNPAALEIDQGKSEIVYLYIAPTSQVANGRYTATISVRLEDSAILESETISISVTESRVDVEAGQEQKSFWSSITGFFARLFSPGQKEETTTNETNVNVSETNETEEQEETTEEEVIEEEPEQTEEEQEEVQEPVLNETETNETESNTTVTGTGFATALSNSFSSIASFTAQQKTTLMIILVIIIIILLIIRTGLHKKIAKFFEEEQIEEEKPKVEEAVKQEQLLLKDQKTDKKETVHKQEVKKEEPKKEDKKDKKEVKKEEPKKDDDDEDEVIIEFDDD